jgi:Family of unknown function (DUF6525)
MGNSVDGGYRTTEKLSMRAFDKLPKSAREALAGAIENWVPQPILTRHNNQRRGYETGAEIAATVDRWNREELATRENQRRRAVGPYKGNVPDAGCGRARRKATLRG